MARQATSTVVHKAAASSLTVVRKTLHTSDFLSDSDSEPDEKSRGSIAPPQQHAATPKRLGNKDSYGEVDSSEVSFVIVPQVCVN